MRIPISGIAGSLPMFHEYDYRITHANYRPVFSIDKTGLYGDTFFDLGGQRSVITSVASNGIDTMWAWSPATAGSTLYADKVLTSSNIRLGRANGTYTEVITPLTCPTHTRVDMYHNGSTYLLGVLVGNEVRVYNASNLLSGTTTLIASVPYTGVTGSPSLSILGTTSLWISWISNGISKLKHYNGSVWTEYTLSSHKTLEHWHATGTRVVLYAGAHYIFYQESANRAVVRKLQGGQLSEPMSVLGADSEYAFQASMVSEAIVLNNRILVSLVRGVEGASGVPTAWFSSIFYNIGDNFCDWSGITSYFRGGVGIANGELVAVSTDYAYTSPNTVITSASAWTEIDGVGGWSYEAQPNAAGAGATELELNVGTSYPSPGSLIRRYFTVDNTEYLYSTESVDTLPQSLSHIGLSGGLRSRGLLKHAITYKSTVDELYSSGGKRLVDFSFHSTVGKSGTWLHNTDSVPNRMTVEDDDGGYAIAILPEPVIGSIWYSLVALAKYENAGPVFLYENNENYWRIRYTSGQYLLESIISGVVTVRATWFSPATEEARFLVQIVDDKVYFYVSSPLVPSTNSNLHFNIYWSVVGQYTFTSAQATKYYVGYFGKNGASVSHMYTRRHGIDQTIGSIARSVMAKSGVELNMTPQIQSSSTPHGLSTTPLFYESVRIEQYDVQFNMNITGAKYCYVYLGGPRQLGVASILPTDWAYRVTLRSTMLELHGTDGQAWVPISFMSLPSGYQIFNGNRIRISVTRSDDLTYTTMTVYVNDRLYWSTPLPTHMDSGYLAFSGTVDVYNILVPGLNYPVSDYIWQYDRNARDAVAELFDPFFWIMYEKNDGTVLATPREAIVVNAGNVDTSTQMLDDNPVDEFYSVIKVEGAETYAVYVEPSLIGRGIRYLNVDSPYLYDEASCMTQAYRMAKYWEKAINRSGFRSFLDPRLELMDSVTINGVEYVIDGYNVQVQGTREPSAMITANTRRA